MWLFVLFLAVPMIEIALFVQVGGFIGLWPTLAIVLVTAILGTQLVRAQGVLAINQLRSSFSDLRDPTEPLANGAMILVAGALLLTPGFFTDAVGFLLLIPAVRTLVFNYIRARVSVQGFSMGGERPNHPRRGDNTVIDADYEVVEPDDHTKSPGNSGWTKH
jgi:UPF0716 protein FxsA